MSRTFKRIKRYLSQPLTGAALLYVALAFALAMQWLELLFSSGAGPATALERVFASSERTIFFAWTMVSFAVSAWLAYVFLRRRPASRALRRLLLVAVVHALGAIRFFDWGLTLLAVLPIFALLPALLLSAQSDDRS